MTAMQGSLRETPIFDVVRTIHFDRLSGLLSIRSDEQSRRFYFVHGELYLPGSHRLAQSLAQLLAAIRDGAPEEMASEATPQAALRAVLSRMAELMARQAEGEFVFEPEIDNLPTDLVGPLPSAFLVMEAAVVGETEESLLSKLGGDDAIVVSHEEPTTRATVLAVEPALEDLLALLDTPSTIVDLAERYNGERGALVRDLYRLQAIKLAAILATGSTGVVAADRSASTDEVDPFVGRVLDRVGEELRQEPVAIDPAEHRQQVAALLADVGQMSHYEVLGIEIFDDHDRVHSAFEELARLVHPSNAKRLGWSDQRAVMTYLFERATEAYRVLSDPDRRAEYNREAAISTTVRISGEQRKEELEELARSQYQRARELAENEEYYFACELAKQAVRNAPRAEYWALLGGIQRHNPKWLRDAQESYRRAVELDPEEPEHRIELARLYERVGQTERAKVCYRAILSRNPDDSTASAALKRLARYGTASAPEQGGLLDWLRSLFGR